MVTSEMDEPLISDNRAREGDVESQVSGRISSVNEDYVAVPGSETDEHVAPGPQRRTNWSGIVAVSASCIAAILLVCAGVVSCNLNFMQPASSVAAAGKGQLSESDMDIKPYADDYYGASKTSFHFQPEKNWMNDPNAPLFYGGFYHFFYQYNCNEVKLANISWGHAVSTDMVHWFYLEPALYPDQWYDIDGVWSGSATILEDGTPAIIYTGGRTEDGVTIQSQSLAVPEDPSDPLLRKWLKSEHNPIFSAPEGYKAEDFRDPTTAWKEDDGFWRVAIGTKIDRADGTKDGMGLLYKSTDFEHWELEKDYLHDVVGSGMWECVDFFPVYVEGKNLLDHYNMTGAQNYLDSYKYILKASLDIWSEDHYTIGTYSIETHKFTVDDPTMDLGHGFLYDYGKFYASKSFYDESTGRRIVWSWCNESDSEQDDIIKGWASVQAIPRTIWMDGLTQRNLLTWPIEEIEHLRGAHHNYKNIELKEGEVMKVEGGDGPQLDILISFEKPDVSLATLVNLEEFDCGQDGSAKKGVFGPFGVLVLADDNQVEQTAIFVYIKAQSDGQWGARVCNDQTRSSLHPGLDQTVDGSFVTVLATEDEINLRILVDHSIVETFAMGGRMAITSRIYPTVALGDYARTFLFNNGTTPIRVTNLDVYQMTDVHMVTI